MVNQRQKDHMKDYLVSKLEPFYSSITPKSKEVISGFKSDYIILGENNFGVVLLVDQEYRNDSFKRLFNGAKSQFKEVAGVVLKDGKTFFRSAAEKNYFKKDKLLSLKNYSDEDMRRIILFRPEEIFLNNTHERVHYFQPESSRLGEDIEDFRFKPVIFDYSHINEYERFRPPSTVSKRLFIWVERVHNKNLLN